MEEDEADQDLPLQVMKTEAVAMSADQSGRPRPPVSGDRRQAEGGPDGTTLRQAAGAELEANRGPKRPGTPGKPTGTIGSGGWSCDGGPF